jgi:hypothetical protein
MPKRTADFEQEMSIVSMPVITGGACKHPIVLPCFRTGGVLCFALNAYDPWLNLVVEGRRRGEHCQNIIAFEDEVRQQLKTIGASSSDLEDRVDTASTDQTAAVAGAAGAKTGRGHLGLSDDSDEEAVAAATSKPRIRKASRVQNDFQTVTVRGISFPAKRRPRGRGVCIPVEGSHLPDILQHFRKLIAAGPCTTKTKRGYNKAASETDGPAVAVAGAADKTERVRWIFSQSAWQVRYHDENGISRCSTKGLVVSREHFDGSMLNADDFATAKGTMYRKACERWDELDKSTEPRFGTGQ